jgi:hypothetical protein
MLDWLVHHSHLLGLRCQNWELLIGAGFVLYIVTLIAAAYRHSARH